MLLIVPVRHSVSLGVSVVHSPLLLSSKLLITVIKELLIHSST